MGNARWQMPSKKTIFEHWAPILIKQYNKYWMDLIWDNTIQDKGKYNICFACGTPTLTQRCHIHPLHSSNNNDVGNLHLPCSECHLESEHIDNIQCYYIWFKGKNPLNSGSKMRLFNQAKLYEMLYNHGMMDMIPSYIVEHLNRDKLQIGGNVHN